MQCKNTANDLYIIKDLEVFMNNKIKSVTDEFIPKAVATHMWAVHLDQ